LSQRTCSLCDDPFYAREWCKTHYRRWQRTGDPRGARARAKAIGKGTCECGQPAKVTGKCMRCYQRDWKPGNPKPCTVDECTETARTRGWCPMHYARWLKTGSTDEPVKVIPECSNAECTATATRGGLCDKHYRRKQRASRSTGKRIRARQADWRERTREARRAQYRAWEKRNPEKVSLRDRQNKARRRAVIGSPDPVNYALILAEHGMVCHLCGQPIDGMADLHFDHVIPLARGGAHAAENIRPSHKRCNLRKGARLPSETQESHLLPA
jgi:5-methylcytosine-specific restriction endonuclease McrA